MSKIIFSTTVNERVDVDVDIMVSDLDDDDLRACMEEARTRGLLNGYVGQNDQRKALDGVLHDLMARRYANVMTEFEEAMFGEENSGFLAAYRAMLVGDWSKAILELDYALYPSPAAEMRTLPARTRDPVALPER